MNCSESPSMYCHRSLGSKGRVLLAFSQPATVPHAGNGFAFFFLHPETPAVAARTKAPTKNRFKCFIAIYLLLTSVQQNLAAGRAALTYAGDIDGRPLLQRTRIFAGAATNASTGIDPRLFNGLGVSG